MFQGAIAQAEPLTVAVAANVKYAFADLQQAFTKESGIEVKSVFGSSGKLTAQIKSGAPFDVFLSADMKYPETLYQDGQAVTAPRVYANGVLVLWTLNPLDLSKGIRILNDPAVQKVAVANPRLAPYGREAINALEHFKLRAEVEPKLIYGESISQVNQYIDSKSADIGFTAKSVVLAPQVAGKGKWIELPKDSYQPIAQGVVILKHGTESNSETAHRFLEFLSSPVARAIFEQYGYLLP
ncbi:MAG: molybdate ABC transporter substrate-binding protein [Sideroxydans sp.]|nr:molybdate ABC transporter substrate-binding protein [Sideroxydans sp.]